ncbi:MAG: DsbA family protein [Anaerolineae bacterium]|nr:DsbA family protein [Anaerolineae bacterium]
MTKSRKTSRRRVPEKQGAGMSPVIIGAVIVGALLITAGLIFLGTQSPGATSSTLDLTNFPTMGDPDAPVTMVEYSDFGCPHCRGFNTEKFAQIKSEFIDSGQVKYVVHPYYLGNPQIGLATEAAWCAHDQGGFFEYQHALFERQGQIEYTTDALAGLATELGLDGEALAQCVSSDTHRSDVESARQAATRRGVNSTPTFYVNNQRVEGNLPVSQFETVINQEVALAQ